MPKSADLRIDGTGTVETSGRIHVQEGKTTRDQVCGCSNDKVLEDTSEMEYLPLHSVGGTHTPPIKVPVTINGTVHTFELDTGATLMIVSKGECQKMFPKGTMMKSSLLL